jgi:hypothetical protein
MWTRYHGRYEETLTKYSVILKAKTQSSDATDRFVTNDAACNSDHAYMTSNKQA